MKELLFIFGTRPEAIKMLPIIEFAKDNFTNHFGVKVCVTGQHRQMLDQVLKCFNIKPDYDLNLMSHNQSLSDITSKIIISMSKIFSQYRPNCVLVHGDTTTALAACLSAYYHQIPVAHIEAGLRSFDIYNPWPEEGNRSIIARIAKYHFTPSQNSKRNLIKEGITDNIFIVGNSGRNALMLMVNKINSDKLIFNELTEYFANQQILFNNYTILVTLHRRENIGSGIKRVCLALHKLAINNANIQIVIPVHLNPNIQNPMKEYLGNLKNIKLINPQEYLSFIFLLQKSQLVITDSGGLQEEASFLKKPVLIIRDLTERPESLNNDVKLVGTNTNMIIEEVNKFLTGQFNSFNVFQKNAVNTPELILNELLQQI